MLLFGEAIVLFEKATEKPLPLVISMQIRYAITFVKGRFIFVEKKNSEEGHERIRRGD